MSSVFEDVLSAAVSGFVPETTPRAPSEDPLGYDVSCVDDIDPQAREVEGEEMMAQAWARRLTTARGSLEDDDPDYGTDMFDILHRKMTKAEIEALPGQIRGELTKDERTEDVTVKVLRFDADQRLEVEMDGETAAGPFRRTLVLTPESASLVATGEN